MSSLSQFHFLRPYRLLAVIPLLIAVWWMYKRKSGSRAWESVCDRELLPYILIGNVSTVTRLPVLLTALCGALAIVALAGPVWEKLPQPVYTSQSALVIALDLSMSMDATDISPSRLGRAKFKISDILDRRAEGQTALLVYAGDAFTVTPLTEDIATIKAMLRALTTDIMPVQGNRTELALSKAVELLKRAGASRGDILLMTDEVDIDRAETVAQAVISDGYRISILGTGTAQGAPVPRVDGSFLKDQAGRIVIPVLNEAPMRRLANEGGGRYLGMVMDDSDVSELDRFFGSEFTAGEITETGFETDLWREQGPWLLLLLLPLAALVFRRGYLVLLVAFCLPYTQPVQASTWDMFWKRPDQQANRAMEQGEYEKATELFEDPAWKGAAAYRAGKFAEAEKWLSGLDGIVNSYNYANALARQGRYADAIALYESILDTVPDHEDARFNKELLERELEQQQQQQQQSGEDQESADQDQEQGDEERQNDQGTEKQSGDEQAEDDQGLQEPEVKPDQDRSASPDHTDQDDTGMQEQASQMMDQSPQFLEDDSAVDEEQQATEQWLRRIPDDPSELLRRKFLYQHQQRREARVPGEKSW